MVKVPLTRSRRRRRLGGSAHILPAWRAQFKGPRRLIDRAYQALRLVGAAALTGLVITPSVPRVGLAAAAMPQPAHVVIVVEENRSEGNIIGSKSTPFINALAANGANMAQSFAETHPSEPNYLALFAGSTLGVTKDACPVNGGDAPNLASELLAAGYTFVGYAEGLPAVGSTVCSAGKYARKHVPWANFTNVPPANSLPFSAFPMGNYASLPTVSFVIPNNDDNMHDGSIAPGRCLAEPRAVGLRQLGGGQQQPADRDVGRGRRRQPQPDPDHHSTAATSSPAPTTSRSATTTCFPPSSRCTGCPKPATRPALRRSPSIWAAYAATGRRAVAIVCRMAADLVPIRLSLSDGDRYTVWAPRWRDAGDEWEAFLGKDEDLYVFDHRRRPGRVRAFRHRQRSGRPPGVEGPDLGARARPRTRRGQAVRSGRRRGAGVGEADRRVGDRAGGRAGDRLVHRIGVRAVGGVEVLQRQPQPGHRGRRHRHLHRQGRRQTLELDRRGHRTQLGRRARRDRGHRQHPRRRRRRCRTRPPTSWPKSATNPKTTKARPKPRSRRGQRPRTPKHDEEPRSPRRRSRTTPTSSERRGAARPATASCWAATRTSGCRWASTRFGS